MYISGWVVPVPTANREKFREWTGRADAFFKENGATQIVNGWGDDVPDGQVTSFPMAVKLNPDETVVFGWICWPDKATADRAMQGMRDDPRFGPGAAPMPADGKRMIFGGFSLLGQA